MCEVALLLTVTRPVAITKSPMVKGYDLVLALGSPLTGFGLLPLQSGVVPPYDVFISGPCYSTASDAYELASQKAKCRGPLMSGLSAQADLAFYQSVDLASGESRLDDDVHSAGSKQARVDDGDGVTVNAVGRIDDRGNVASLG